MLKPLVGILLVLLLPACNKSVNRQWTPQSWTQMPLQAADARCKYEAQNNLAARSAGGGWLYEAAAYNQAYNQCMNANGWY